MGISKRRGEPIFSYTAEQSLRMRNENRSVDLATRMILVTSESSSSGAMGEEP